MADCHSCEDTLILLKEAHPHPLVQYIILTH